MDWCRRNPRSANLRSRAQSDARALLVHWFLRLRTFGLEGGLSIKEAGTQPGLWFKPFLFYLQQRNGFLSLELVVNPPPQELPLSTAGLSEKLKAWVPAKIGQSPPQVKQRLHATAVCVFATSGASLGAGFPPNWALPPAPPAATCGTCAFAGLAFSIIAIANAVDNNPILLYMRSSYFPIPMCIGFIAPDAHQTCQRNLLSFNDRCSVCLPRAWINATLRVAVFPVSVLMRLEDGVYKKLAYFSFGFAPVHYCV